MVVNETVKVYPDSPTIGELDFVEATIIYAGKKPVIKPSREMDLAKPLVPIKKAETPVMSNVVGGLLKFPI